jgi:hypothetical protein
MLLVYKIMNEKMMVDRSTWFEVVGENNIGGAVTVAARGQLIQAPFAHLDVIKNVFKIRGSKEWNRLPARHRAAKSPESFKNGYRKFTGT